MKKLIVLCLLLLNSCNNNKNTISDIYFGLTPPKEHPEIFAEDIISKGFHEHGFSISPSYDEMFYIMTDISYKHYTIIQLKRENGKWSKPNVAPFSGEYTDHAPAFFSSGNRILFSSERPNNYKKENTDIWMIEKTIGIWGEPINFEILNTEFDDVDPTIAKNGNIYFESNRDGEWNIYVSKLADNQYQIPVKLDSTINTAHTDARPFIAPDESFILFQSDREGPRGVMKIYISHKNESSWSEPILLPDFINSGEGDFNPYISPDGNYFFFGSFRTYKKNVFKNKSYEDLINLYRSPLNGYSTIYWIDANFLKNNYGK